MILFIRSIVVVVTLSSLNAHDDDFGGESFPHNPFLKLPEAPKSAYFCETFSSKDEFTSNWVISQAKKELIDEDIAKYDGEWKVEEPLERVFIGDMGLVLKSKAKHHAISSTLKRPFVFDGRVLVVQFEVKLQRGLECGGAYVKLLMQSDDLDLRNFHDRTPYVIMFGPDKCGNDLKIHFIFRHKNPVTNKFEEKHAVQPSKNLEKIFKDKMTHLYTLIVRPNNSFSILVDLETLSEGDLLQDMKPPVNPPREIVDPDDAKPLDWEDREMIADPNAEKPDNWDETFGREFIPDRSAKVPEGWLEDEEEWIADDRAIKPSDWDEELDGQWEPPLMLNPACEKAMGCGEWNPPLVKNPIFKGPWMAPSIKNPSYKGPWSPRKIPNPNYFFDPLPYNMSSIGAVGIETWSMSVDILFDNFLVTDSVGDARLWAGETWKLKNDVEKSRDVSSKLNAIEAIVEAANERPLLWIPIILAIVFPTLIFIACCCGSPPKPQKPNKSVRFEGPQQKLPKNPQPGTNYGNLRSRGHNLSGNKRTTGEFEENRNA